eukprot:Gb_33875 [translate_table: standard]
MLLRIRSLCCYLILISVFLILCGLLHSAQAANGRRHTTFIFNQFNGSNLILINNASIESKYLSLPNSSLIQTGRALYSAPVQMKSNATLSSFSTTFVFAMVRSSGVPAGPGLAFIMTPYKTDTRPYASQFLGLLNTSSNGQLYNHLFAVEFDTGRNIEFDDINGNHVGVDLNSLKSVDSQPAKYWIGKQFRELNLHTRQNFQAWIDYNHLQDQLNVTIGLARSPRPEKPLISVKNLNLSGILEEEMYVGFSSSTGNFMEYHYILAWSFNTNGTAPVLDVSNLPTFTEKKPKHVSKGFIAGVTSACFCLILILILGAFLWLKRMKYRDFIEDWELEFWPHRLPYRQLSIATNGFREEQLLGSGGFGRVYKGVLPSNGLEVAVKCIIQDSTEGMKEFIAEITSVGRLQHRNLVQLRGWCRRKRQLFIVYDYMPNGSLDKMIFGNPKTVLQWAQRYMILKGVASGLLYLHEQWKQKVVHRDIKSSNVLLDSDLTAALGDFGLARLYDHSENPETTRVVGTLGYIAPELVQTGKATPSTDVFSFGVVLLEVASGRKPVDQSKDVEEVILIDWVWDLYTKKKLMDAVDPKLGGEYDVEEMERVLHLGLMCSYPEPEIRPSIRQVSQILDGEVPLPALHMPSFHNSNTSRHSYVDIAYGISSTAPSSKSCDDTLSTRSSEGKQNLWDRSVCSSSEQNSLVNSRSV